MPVQLSRDKMSLQLSGLLSSEGGHRMMDRKDCPIIDIVHQFLFAFVDRTPGYTKNGELNKVNRLYSKLLVQAHPELCIGL